MFVYDQTLVVAANGTHGLRVHQHAMIFESLVIEGRLTESVRLGRGQRDPAVVMPLGKHLAAGVVSRKTQDPRAWWMTGGSLGPMSISGATPAEPFTSAFSTNASSQPGQ